MNSLTERNVNQKKTKEFASLKIRKVGRSRKSGLA